MKVLEKGRAQYRKIKNKIKTCSFCDPKVIKQQSVKSLEGKYWLVFANKYPYLDGNLMLIPKRHICQLEDLNTEEQSEFFKLLEKSKKALGRLFETDSFNCGINIGQYSGCSIAHIHWQLLPRRKYTQNACNIIHDLHIITMDHHELIKKLNRIK
ncbi:MAG: HIT domain-containing protein [Candidatus Parcubacteria bacterium]|nr:HIT domain-containing protein [Candidatus Parcubacteria bacterium]